MSSHREAPESSKDPVTDNTDTYAFVSPDRPDTVTIITNYIPLEDPAGGPNFFEFGDDVLYEINIDNNGDGRPDVTYEFRFHDDRRQPGELPVQHRTDRRHRQPDRSTGARRTPSPRCATTAAGRSAADLASPPCNVGLRSTPNYAALAQSAVFDLRDGIRSSPASASTASTSTSAPSSTSPPCDRSRTST